MRISGLFPGLLFSSLLVAASVAYSEDTASSPVLHAMKAELARSLETFKSQPTPPYSLSYEITDDRTVSISGSFGTITASDEDHRRQLDIDLRVGDYQLDNTHQVRGGFPDFGFFNRISMIPIPLEDDPAAIRTVLWVVRRLRNPLLGDPEEMMSSALGMFMPTLCGGGGVTQTAVLAYEVFPDGEEKLVRSAQLESINEASFKDLVAASDSETVDSTLFLDIGNAVRQVFSGSFFAGTLQPPIVSLVVPNLLFEEVTVSPPSREIPKPPLSKPPLGK